MLRRPLRNWIFSLTLGTVGVLALLAPEASWASVPRVRHSGASHPVAKNAVKRPAPLGAALRQRQFAHASRRPVVSRSASRRSTAWAPKPASVTRASYGTAFGLGAATDPLALKSNAALVLDQDSNETLLSKNARAVLPIASLTKLMTSVVVLEAAQDLNEWLTISSEDIDTEKGSHSRLAIGTQLPRSEMLHLALMSSENRAANALGRHYPGGLSAFVEAMNRKAQELGMRDTRYVEPTGLSSSNQSSAQDLAMLVKYAYKHTLIRELSTSQESEVLVGERPMQFRNTNSLVRNPEWEIGLQKTGYISEAGRCLVMQARLAGRRLIMVFLDSAGKYSRQADAERVRRWLENEGATTATLVSHATKY